MGSPPAGGSSRARRILGVVFVGLWAVGLYCLLAPGPSEEEGRANFQLYREQLLFTAMGRGLGWILVAASSFGLFYLVRTRQKPGTPE